jgi:hypothetical protein
MKKLCRQKKTIRFIFLFFMKISALTIIILEKGKKKQFNFSRADFCVKFKKEGMEMIKGVFGVFRSGTSMKKPDDDECFCSD